jgi:hypothetical protein
MGMRFIENSGRSTGIGRRAWLARVAAGLAAVHTAPRPFASGDGPDNDRDRDTDPGKDRDAELELRAIERQAELAGIGPLSTVRSRHYQAIGDASPKFMAMIVKDCELLTLDYLAHFRRRGFDVHPPDHRLTLVAFLDERPFHKFFPESARANIVGGYSKEKNWVVLFDWRNVPQRHRSGIANMTTLAHEAMHQLCFNTGLLSREADTPLAIVEGLAMYAEIRNLNGRSDLGRVNRSRLDDLAHILRRHDWIPFKELMVLDQSVLNAGRDQVDLFYAESWLLASFLLKDPDRLPLFREYLKAVAARDDHSHRIEDAETHFGNLDRFDRDLRAYLIRTQRGR